MIVQITEDIVRKIHDTIHNKDLDRVEINGRVYSIEMFKDKWRSIRFGNVTFAEQNQDKPSVYSRLAKGGAKITWGMKYPAWIRVVDGVIHIPPYTMATLKD